MNHNRRNIVVLFRNRSRNRKVVECHKVEVADNRLALYSNKDRIGHSSKDHSDDDGDDDDDDADKDNNLLFDLYDFIIRYVFVIK